MLILHIEDDSSTRRALQRVVELEGHALISAENLAQARRLVEDRSPEIDLVFTDVGLPDGEGLDLLPLIHERMPAAPVYVLSAHDPRYIEQRRAQVGGFTGLLSKPVSLLEVLPPILRQWANQKRGSQPGVTYACTD